MNDSFLTIEEMLALNTLLVSRGIVVEDMALGRSVRSHEGQEDEALPSLLVLEQQGRVRLSEETRRREEERLAKLARKKRSLRHRNNAKVKRGRRHHRAKAATVRRNRAKLWASNPLLCLLYRNRYTCKAIDKKLWDEYIMPIWRMYEPSKLNINTKRGTGTRADPWTIYNIDVVHKELGILYKGEDQLLYDLSCPTGEEEHSDISILSG